MMQHVVIFGAESRNLLGLVRSMGESGVPVDVVLEPINRRECSVRFSRYVSRIFYLARREDAVEFLLQNYNEEGSKVVVLCEGDRAISLLDAHFNLLKDKFCIFNAQCCQGRIVHFLDKFNTYPVAQRCGLKLIKTWEYEYGQEIPCELTYPCLIKGRNSTASTKGDCFVCLNEEALRDKTRVGVKYLLQEYIKGECELCIVGFAYNQGMGVYLPATVRKIRESLYRQSDYITIESLEDYPGFDIQAVKLLIKEIGYEGIFSVEFIKKGADYYFLEVNLRNDGCGYLYTLAGVNMPFLWYLYSKGQLSEKVLKKLKLKLGLRMMALRDVLNIREGKITFCQWLIQWFRVDAYSEFSYRDPIPSLFSFCLLIKRMGLKTARGIKRLLLGSVGQ